jgi:hypothetical protein
MFKWADSAFSTGFIPHVPYVSSISSVPVSVPVPSSSHTSSPVDSDGGLSVCWDSASSCTIFTSEVDLINVRPLPVPIEVTVGGGTSACITIGDFDGHVLVNGTQRPIFVPDVRVIPNFGINVHPFSSYSSISIQDSTATATSADEPTFQALKQSNGFFYAKLTPKVQESVPSLPTEPPIMAMSMCTSDPPASVPFKSLDLAPAKFSTKPAFDRDKHKDAQSSVKTFHPG